MRGQCWRLLVCLSIAFCGCALTSSLPKTIKPLDATTESALVADFTRCRSIEAVDLRLKALVDAPDGQQQAECLLRNWGQHGSWCDLAAVKFLAEYWPGAYSKYSERFDRHRLFDEALASLERTPALWHHASWYAQWKNGPGERPWFRRGELVTFGMGPCVRVDGEYLPHALLVLGLVDDSWPFQHSVGNLRWESLESDVREAELAIAIFHPYLRYNHERGYYSLDREAYDEQRYLPLEEQLISPRKAPLPDWDCGEIPTHPSA